MKAIHNGVELPATEQELDKENGVDETVKRKLSNRKIYRCTICPYQGKRKDRLKKHVQSVHEAISNQPKLSNGKISTSYLLFVL